MHAACAVQVHVKIASDLLADAVVTWPGGMLGIWQRHAHNFVDHSSKRGAPVPRPMLKVAMHVARKQGMQVSTLMTTAFDTEAAADGQPESQSVVDARTAQAWSAVKALLSKAGVLPDGEARGSVG
jgi:hypothetical protein